VRRHIAAALLAALPAGGAVAEDTPGPEQIAATVTQIETVIVEVDAMVADQDARLDDLYARREAAEPGPRQAALDQLIDTLTLQLDEAEALRATLEGQADALRQTLATVEPDPVGADLSQTDGDSDE